MADTPTHQRFVVRAEDLLVLKFDFYNLVPASGDSPELRRVDPAASAHIVVHFPSQHVLEEAFYESADDWVSALFWWWFVPDEVRPLADSLGAAASRVAFVVPGGVEAVPLKLNELLAFLTRCELNVVATASGIPRLSVGTVISFLQALLGWISRERWSVSERGPLEAPASDQTAIEIPYRMILSPPPSAGFAHESVLRPLPDQNLSELWHSRLGVRPGFEGTVADSDKRTVRAVWVRGVDQEPLWNPVDYRDTPSQLANEPPFLASMREFHRHAIAHLSANSRDLETQPIEVERLALSALGGWLAVYGRWQSPPREVNLQEWTHRAALGRDYHVRLVEVGYLFPFGHRAALVTITERKWQELARGRPAALHQRMFVIVRQPERQYSADPGDRFGRTMPLKRVRLRTLVTPDMDSPVDKSLFRPTVFGRPFAFAIEADDGNGGTTTFAMPLVFIAPARATDAASIDAANVLLAQGGHHRADLGGSLLALVQERPGQAGHTTFPVSNAAFGADLGGGEPGFHPRLLNASVALPAVELVSGQGEVKTIEYVDRYRDRGFGGTANRGELFARLVDPLRINFGSAADKAGGLLQPSLGVTGLSRAVGPVGGNDLGALADGMFDPAKFFEGAPSEARLFGVFTLAQVLRTVAGDLDADGAAPKLVSRRPVAPPAADWRWSPQLKPFPDDKPVFVPKAGARLTLEAQVEAKDPDVKREVHCTLENIELHLLPNFPFFELPVERIAFHSVAGTKPDIDVVLGESRFVGALSFVDELRKYIPVEGFSDPPAIEVTPRGITSGFSMALPDLAVGMFALQHVALGSRLEVPFTGPPMNFSFNFCTREAPFLLTVSMFGGGGFFLVKVDPNGLQRLEASFEFGASVSMNFGVASGGVHVMAGIYFAFDTGKGVALYGYFRAGGNVSVLGIVSVSIELSLGLAYEAASGKALGRATLTVEIELFLFSQSVEIECERRFAGSSSDPPFELVMGPYPDPDDPHGGQMIDPWDAYCRAYA